jgi:hypothetical protein
MPVILSRQDAAVGMRQPPLLDISRKIARMNEDPRSPRDILDIIDPAILH